MPDRPLERPAQLLVSNLAVATFPSSIIGSRDRTFLFAKDGAAPFRLWWLSPEEVAVNVDATNATAVVAYFQAAGLAVVAPEPGGTCSIPRCTRQASGWHCGLVRLFWLSTHTPIHAPTRFSLLPCYVAGCRVLYIQLCSRRALPPLSTRLLVQLYSRSTRAAEAVGAVSAAAATAAAQGRSAGGGTHLAGSHV
jgi:hypothetical protein